MAGVNNGGGVGVYGVGGTGVFGTGTVGFATDSNVQQSVNAGGWVKAMVYVHGRDNPYQIDRCFNSTLTGAAATTPPCGIDLEEVGIGIFDLNFNFSVSNRFVSATPNATQYYFPVGIGTAQNNNTVEVATWTDDQIVAANFTLIVF